MSTKPAKKGPFQTRLLSWFINRFRIEEGDNIRYKHFEVWQDSGFHITPNHFYQPIPDTSKLARSVFKKERKLVGVDFNVSGQKKILHKLARFKSEYNKFVSISEGVDDQLDPNFYFDNLAFDNVDALVYYSMIRLFKPGRIVEVGSGWSTKIAAAAAVKNEKTELISIEPYPQTILRKGFPGLSKVVEKEVQNVSLKFFEELQNNDMLFIDSSHSVKIGGDVNFLFLEVLPRIKKGVLVHIHDIFFPFDYPKSWVLKQHRFWTEQYLLQAFLMFNKSFEVIYSSSFMAANYSERVKKVFPSRSHITGGSLWLRRTKD